MALSIEETIIETVCAQLQADSTVASVVNGFLPGESPFIPAANYPLVEVFVFGKSALQRTTSYHLRRMSVAVRVTTRDTEASGSIAFDTATGISTIVLPYQNGYQVMQAVERVLRDNTTINALSSGDDSWLLQLVSLGDTVYEGVAIEGQFYYQWSTSLELTIKEAR